MTATNQQHCGSNSFIHMHTLLSQSCNNVENDWRNKISFSKGKMTKSVKGRMLEVKISSSKVSTEYMFCLSIKWPYKMEHYSVRFQCTFLDRLEGMFMFSKLNDLCWSIIKTKTQTKPRLVPSNLQGGENEYDWSWDLKKQICVSINIVIRTSERCQTEKPAAVFVAASTSKKKKKA